MSQSPLPHAFSIPATLDEFNAGAGERERARAALELACACGALLGLESAFANNPLVTQLSLDSDCEGSFTLELFYRDRDGAPVAAFIVGDWAYCALEHENKNGPALSERERLGLFAAMGQRELSSDAIFDAMGYLDSCFHKPLRAFESHAPSLFFPRLGSSTLIIRPDDAIGIARQMGAPELGAALEAAKLDRSSRTASPRPGAPRGL